MNFKPLFWFLLCLSLWACRRDTLVPIEEACCVQAVHYQEGNCYLSIPTLFTPNGDGKNDGFKVHYHDVCTMSNFKLKVTNYKNGVVLLQTSNPLEEWKPTVPTSGFATYRLELTCRYAGKSFDIDQPIAIYDDSTYLYSPIALKCCERCALPDMFIEGQAEPQGPSADDGFCE